MRVSANIPSVPRLRQVGFPFAAIAPALRTEAIFRVSRDTSAQTKWSPSLRLAARSPFTMLTEILKAYPELRWGVYSINNAQIGGPLSSGTGRDMLRLGSSQYDPTRTFSLATAQCQDRVVARTSLNCVTHLNRRLSARELADRGAAHQLHVALYFSLHQAERPLDASLAGRSQRLEIVAADADRLGADRERLQDMGSPLHPAIHEHVDPITHSVDDFGQLVE